MALIDRNRILSNELAKARREIENIRNAEFISDIYNPRKVKTNHHDDYQLSPAEKAEWDEIARRFKPK